MDFEIGDALDLLGRTPTTLRAMLSGLGERWTHANYGEKTFSPFDVVGHLIHGERTDWLCRAKIILEHGEGRPFEPFDRYAMYEASKGKTIAGLLDTFESLRSANLGELAAMNPTPDKLSLRGTHPEFGAVTLGALLSTWVVHDWSHIAQIAKALAHQYREAVGPWGVYLSIIPK